MKKEHVFEEETEKRWCGKCKMYKNIISFGYSKNTWDKLKPTCKPCLKKYNLEHIDEKREYNKKYWQETKKQQYEKCKKWREENLERVKENMKKWLEKNKEYKKQKDKEYREKHKEQYRENHKNWVTANYIRMKNENGVEFLNYKIKSNIGRRIREILGQNKSEKSLVYVGCSLDKLKIHLEKSWVDGMTWENYGRIFFHVRHLTCNTPFI
jgi:hypothetical protein